MKKLTRKMYGSVIFSNDCRKEAIDLRVDRTQTLEELIQMGIDELTDQGITLSDHDLANAKVSFFTV